MPPLSSINNLNILRIDHDPECSSPEVDRQQWDLLCKQYCVYFLPSWELGKDGLIRQMIEMSGETWRERYSNFYCGGVNFNEFLSHLEAIFNTNHTYTL